MNSSKIKQKMSDISEHDSDSDADTSGSKTAITTDVPTEVKTDICFKDTVVNQSTGVVDELKKQASLSSDDRPDWVKYLEQNQETGTYTYTDQTDGMVYEWDQEKKGWMPKIDDDFIALYQANYGFTATGEHNPNIHVAGDGADDKCGEDDHQQEPVKSYSENTNQIGKKPKEDEKKEWFDIDQKVNNTVYVSGLPMAITNDEFVELMLKCGIIMEDDEGTLKIKLYRDSSGKVKGDGRCCYLKHESVILACKLLDDSEYNGCKISVEQAVFELKGNYNPSLKPKKKKKKKKKATQDKLLDWVDRPKKRSKFDRIVILKNMFDNKEFEQDPSLINELKEDLNSECGKFGDIKKLLVFDRNPEGVASILFSEPEFADSCIEGLNGRYYAGKTISAETYDGMTKYDVQETEEELKKRLDQWEHFLGCEDEND